MLYDPKWNKTLLDQWIGWLETKDPDETYDWSSLRRCACGQFYGSDAWEAESPEWSRLNKIARGDRRFFYKLDWTFGKCLERAKAYRDH